MRITRCLALGVAAAGVAAETVNLYHRVVSHGGANAPFSLRGTVDVDVDVDAARTASSSASGAATYSRAEAAHEDVARFVQHADAGPQSLYQVALERAHDSGAGQDQWAVSSVKLCHVSMSASDIVRLHVDARGSPFALDYFLVSTPHDGACPSPKAAAAAAAAAPLSNTTVLLLPPSHAPAPLLRAPPQLTAEGKPLKKDDERSFLQKYWPYIVGFLVLQFVLGSAPQEDAAEGGEGAGKGK